MTLTPTVRFLTAGFVCATLVSACSGSVSIGKVEVSQSDVESQVASQLGSLWVQIKQPAPKVSCPGGLEAKVGVAIDCTLTPQGGTTTYPVHVTVTSVNNSTAHFKDLRRIPCDPKSPGSQSKPGLLWKRIRALLHEGL
jgi:hypothetical protein